MAYRVRLMRQEDIVPVTEIDREAFPTLLPPTDYQRELKNQLAHYIVAYDDERIVDKTEAETALRKIGWLSRLGRLFSGRTASPGMQYVVGFAGFWIMAEEAHIINLAVCQPCRRKGIGELLLICLTDLATALKANLFILEVRASNTAALSLYHKYGFTVTGRRRGYYSDDREDAVVMTAPNIDSPPFRVHLEQLKKAHSRKWGMSIYKIGR